MSIYQRGENWYIDFTFKGQRIRESIGPSRKDAEKVIAKKKTEIVENKYLDIRKDPDPITFHKFAKEYLQWAKTNKKPSTYARDLAIMKVLDKVFTGNMQDITTWQIEKFKAKRKETCKVGSVNRELALVKHLFTKAIEWRKTKENPSKSVKFLKGAEKRVRFLMPADIQKLISNCVDWLKPIVTVAVHTGMRKSELLGLKWNQVNFEQGIITLFDTKNHERRDIPMDETVKATLSGIVRKKDFVFIKKWAPAHPLAVHLAFKEALQKSGIEDFKFHDLRHTFASNLVMQEGVELNEVRELLGHKTMSMTLRYAHLSPKHRTRVISILDRVMSQIPPQEKKVVNLRPQNNKLNSET